ncbi:histidine phosphatase family protein [Saccharopolyspora griseoalba]|uniref:Histidine phosphatase family protein n=1 Tax=Saccharopolyspora griseoalba TaxID=1431848 RepID=A0ABW2LMT5_9PSEU
MTNGFELTAPAGVRLILARHGQTPANVAKILDTLPPGPGLTELGETQAEALAERLADEKVVAVHASRALRAQRTAAPLAAHHGVEVQIAEGTHEIYVGELEALGTPEALGTFEQIYQRWQHGELDLPMPGGETARQAVARFLEGARGAIRDVDAGSVVMVSHGAMLRLVAGALVEIDHDAASAHHLPNTGLIVLESTPETPTGWTCLSWDGIR